jgi:antitoxin component YwqK of YwqJK toxin-antitoxin module
MYRIDGRTIQNRFMYKGNVKSGLHWEYNDNTICLSSYGSDGKYDYMVIWYPTGELMSMTTKTKTYEWDITGIKRYEISRRNGLNHGPYKEWDANGKFIGTVQYNKGSVEIQR